MGVIKKNDSKVGLFSPVSEDSFQVAQSDDELSIASVSTDVSANIPQPIPQQRNYPKPMSFHNTRRRMGKKQSRRHDNEGALPLSWQTLQDTPLHMQDYIDLVLQPDRTQMGYILVCCLSPVAPRKDTESLQTLIFVYQNRSMPQLLTLLLETLVEESEVQEITLKDLMQNPSPGFSRLFEGDNMEKWYDFMESSEEVQKKIIDHGPKKRSCSSDPAHDAGKEFQRIKSGIRNLLKRSHVPVGMLTFLETEVVNFFTKSPQSVYISGILSSFERLLLHAISQYHQLCSFSRTDESSRTRHVHVWNDNDGYTIPKMLLSEYLESREQKSQVK